MSEFAGGSEHRSELNPAVVFCGQTLKGLAIFASVIAAQLAGASASHVDLGDVERQIVSLKEDGSQISLSASAPSISRYGRRVAFSGLDENTVKGSSPFQDIYVRDRDLNATWLVSGGDKDLADGPSFQPSMALDGNFVAFSSQASNLICSACDANSTMDVFLYDIGNRSVQRISQTPKDADGPSYQPSVSRDGNRVAFTSYAGNLVGNDTNASRDIFVWDRFKGLKRISLSPQGDQFLSDSHSPRISGDGRWVVFVTEAELEPEQSHVFARNLDTDTTFRVSEMSATTQTGRNLEPSISENGDMIAWVTNGYKGRGEIAPYRIFVRQMVSNVACLPVCVVTNPNTIELNRVAGEQRQPQIFGWAGRVSPPASLAGPAFGVVYTSVSKDSRRDIVIDNNEFFADPDDYILTISAGAFGAEANGNSQNPTAWGPPNAQNWYVAFDTSASNLVADINDTGDIVLVEFR